MARNVIVINVDFKETRVALIEDGVIAELQIERAAHRSTVGNIVLGKVTRVLPGMQAAFIDVGQERAAFLHVEDLIRPDDFDAYLSRDPREDEKPGSSPDADGEGDDEASEPILTAAVAAVAPAAQLEDAQDGRSGGRRRRGRRQRGRGDRPEPRGTTPDFPRREARPELAAAVRASEGVEGDEHGDDVGVDEHSDDAVAGVEPGDLEGPAHALYDASEIEFDDELKPARASRHRIEELDSGSAADVPDVLVASDSVSPETDEDEDEDEDLDDDEDDPDSEELDEEFVAAAGLEDEDEEGSELIVDEDDDEEDDLDDDADELDDEDEDEEDLDDDTDELDGDDDTDADDEVSDPHEVATVIAAVGVESAATGDAIDLSAHGSAAAAPFGSEDSSEAIVPPRTRVMARRRTRPESVDAEDGAVEGTAEDSDGEDGALDELGAAPEGVTQEGASTLDGGARRGRRRRRRGGRGPAVDARSGAEAPDAPSAEIADGAEGDDGAAEDNTDELASAGDVGGKRRRRRGRRRRGNEPKAGQAPVVVKAVKAVKAVAPVVTRPSAKRMPPRVSRSVPISEVVREGDRVVVQISKEPIGTKGARVTSHVSLPGRYVVYLPTVEHVGISKRIGNARERSRLRQSIEALKPKTGGLIVRTVAEGLTKKQLKADVGYLIKVWAEVAKRRETARPADVLYEELDLVLKAARDLFTDEVDHIIIDDRDQHGRLCRFVEMFMPGRVKDIKLYNGEEPIFDAYGIEDEIKRALSRKVPLPSGGSLIVDQAEALTAIDVNTGRYVGKGSKDLEETALKTNLEAVDEIAYQLRFRNLGGLVILDLIDMERADNRERVWRTLEQKLAKDKAKTTINRISDLGLIEMTRKRTRESLGRIMHEPCFYCDGTGHIQSRETIAYEILRQIRRDRLSLAGYSVRVLAHPAVTDFLKHDARDAMADAERRYLRRIELVPRQEYHIEQYDLQGR